MAIELADMVGIHSNCGIEHTPLVTDKMDANHRSGDGTQGGGKT
jgi:hypothetical protein